LKFKRTYTLAVIAPKTLKIREALTTDAMGRGDDPVIAEQSSSADMDAILPQGNAVWLGSHIRRQPAGLACTQGHDDQEDGKEEELSL